MRSALPVTCVLALTLGVGACAGSPSPDRAGTESASRTPSPASSSFQAELDAELRDSGHSMLTAVAGYYLQVGDRLGLALERGEGGEQGWVESAAPSVRFESTEGAVLVSFGEQPQRRFEAHTILDALGQADEARAERWRFELSTQGGYWRVLVHDAQSPTKQGFSGVDWYPVDGAYVTRARFEPAAAREPQELQTSRGETKTLYRAGTLHFELGGEALELIAFGYAPEAPPAGELEPALIPFRDGTTGKGSYGAGRYIELEISAEAHELSLDFNRATNPLCAYSEHYNCPFPPRFNKLERPIPAGAMAPAGEH